MIYLKKKLNKRRDSWRNPKYHWTNCSLKRAMIAQNNFCQRRVNLVGLKVIHNLLSTLKSPVKCYNECSILYIWILVIFRDLHVKQLKNFTFCAKFGLSISHFKSDEIISPLKTGKIEDCNKNSLLSSFLCPASFTNKQLYYSQQQIPHPLPSFFIDSIKCYKSPIK